jgi:hypothetical protein
MRHSPKIKDRLPLLTVVKDSATLWYKRWPSLLLSCLSDLAFLFILGIIMTFIQFTLFEHLEALMKLTGEATGGLMNIYNETLDVSVGLSGLSGNTEFQYHVSVIFKYLGIMVLATFVLWIIFQGLSWYIAYRATKDKDRMKFLVFMKNFALQSVPFYLLSVLWIFLSVRILVWIKMSTVQVMSETTLNILFIIFVMITWYFGTLCYTITGKYAYKNFKEAFRYGIFKFSKVIQSFAVLVILFFIIDQILRLSFIRQDSFVLMVFGILLLIPAIFFARILLFKTSEMYVEEQVQHRHHVK